MTKWIILRETLSGGRPDGRPWPPAGTPIDVADWEAEHNVAAGWAYYTDPPEPEPSPEPEQIPEPEPVQAEAGVPAVPAVAEAAAAEPVPETPEEALPEPPRPGDPKQAWVDYAVTRGMDAEKAAGESKADLMSRYGGRL